MLQVGDKIVWAEIKEGGSNKRFLLPSEPVIINKLQALLSQHAGLFLIRHGEGEVRSAGVESGAGKIFECLDYVEDLVFGANILHGHPDINQGSLRYSKSFIEAVVAQETMASSISSESYVQPTGTALGGQEPSAPAAPSGIDAIRARFAGSVPQGETNPPQQVANHQAQATGAVNITHQPSVPAAPVAPPAPAAPIDPNASQKDFRAQLDKAATSQPKDAYQEHQAFAPYIDNETQYIIAGGTVKRVEEILNGVNTLLAFATVPDKGVTGKQLASWFRESIESRGYDQTFELLASKLKGLE